MQTAETTPRSDVIITIGLTFVAALMVVVGVQHLHFATFVATLVPAWIPWRFFWACFVGVSFFAAAASFVSKIQVRLAGILLGMMFLIFVLIVHSPRIAIRFRNQNEWTSGFVALAMTGVGFILASAFAKSASERNGLLGTFGRACFAVTFVAFGIQHVIWAKLGAGVGPPWIPGNSVLALLAGIVLLVLGAWILFGKKTQTPALLLGALLFFYTLALYAPWIIRQPGNPGPWTSGFEILAMSGGALVLSRISRSSDAPA